MLLLLLLRLLLLGALLKRLRGLVCEVVGDAGALSSRLTNGTTGSSAQQHLCRNSGSSGQILECDAA